MMEMADYWYWLIAGLVLMVLEIVTPGVFFLWIGIGAFITGALAWLFPALDGAVLGSVFAVLAVASAFIGKKLIGKKEETKSTLNRRAEQYVGHVYQVYEPVVDGRGKISVADTVWPVVAKENIAANTAVKVTGVKGTFLEVEPLHDN